MKKRFSFLLLILISSCCCAQTTGYKYSAGLGKIEKSGFYNIALTPELTTYLKADLSDIRVCDSSGRWIPHIIQTPANMITGESLIWDHPFVVTENSPAGTTVIIHSGAEEISNFSIIIKNTSAQRFVDLSGSDDQQAWSVINDSILPDPATAVTQTTSSIKLHFPPVNYKFIKLQIHNNNLAPLAILKVNSHGGVNIPERLALTRNLSLVKMENPDGIIRQKDSGKISYVEIIQPKASLFSEISISVKSPKYFSREASLYIPDTAHPDVYPGKLIQSFTISNNSTLEFSFPAVKSDRFYIIIDNADNPPVVVASVKTGYNYMYVTTYLEAGKSYYMFLDNPAATAPDYDFQKLNIPQPHDSMPFLSPVNIKPLKQEKHIALPAKNNKFILWSALILILCLLLFFTSKMLRETNKRNNDNL